MTDGPFAETKEQLGGFGMLEAENMTHAIALLSRHPSLRLGVSTEIRPVDEVMFQCNQALDAKYRNDAAAAFQRQHGRCEVCRDRIWMFREVTRPTIPRPTP